MSEQILWAFVHYFLLLLKYFITLSFLLILVVGKKNQAASAPQHGLLHYSTLWKLTT